MPNPIDAEQFRCWSLMLGNEFLEFLSPYSDCDCGLWRDDQSMVEALAADYGENGDAARMQRLGAKPS